MLFYNLRNDFDVFNDICYMYTFQNQRIGGYSCVKIFLYERFRIRSELACVCVFFKKVCVYISKQKNLGRLSL